MLRTRLAEAAIRATRFRLFLLFTKLTVTVLIGLLRAIHSAGDLPMPTVLRIGAFRFHFYSDEGSEPAHIHVRSADGECKFWLEPVHLAGNRGMAVRHLRDIERLVLEHQPFLIEKFHEYHPR